MIQLLVDNPLLLLFVVAAIGYPLGQVKIQGTRLGVAAVLFVGLAFGALHPDLKPPEVIYSLGLVLFVYTVGLASGSSFLASLRSRGLRDNLLALGMIVFGALLAALAHLLLGSVPVPLPGGVIFKLGIAGGPLVVALALGALGRTGPVVWSLPYSANLVLRQVGPVLFLAGIGTRSGYVFASTLTQGKGWPSSRQAPPPTFKNRRSE